MQGFVSLQIELHGAFPLLLGGAPSQRGKGRLDHQIGKVVYKTRLKNTTFSLEKCKLQAFGHFPSPFIRLGSKWLKVSQEYLPLATD